MGIVTGRPAPRLWRRDLMMLLVVACSVAASPGPPPLLCKIVADCSGRIQNQVKTDCLFSVTDGGGVARYANRASMEYRGRSSLNFPKKNYALSLHDAAGTKLPTDLLGMGQDEDWVMDGSWTDRSFVRNPLSLDSYASLGPSRYGAESRFCTFSLNGANQGIYRLGEKIKRGKDRLALTADDGSGASFIIKQDDAGVLSFSTGRENTWQMVYPKQDTATPAQRAGVQAWLDRFAAALNGANPGDGRTGVFTFLDLDTTVDWVLLQEFSKNIDAYYLSLHLARNAGETARLVPWDFDLAFGQPKVAGGQNTNDEPAGWVVNRTPFIVNLTKAPQLAARMGPRWREIRQGPMSDAAIEKRLANYQAVLAPDAVDRNFSVWPLAAVSFSQIYNAYTVYPVNSYVDELAHLSRWIHARLTWMDAHISAYPNS